jgi:hypothetical protein
MRRNDAWHLRCEVYDHQDPCGRADVSLEVASPAGTAVRVHDIWCANRGKDFR